MSDDLGTAKLNTEVDLSGLEEGLGEAETQTQGRLAGMAENLKGSLGLAFAGIGVALAGALAGAGVAAVDIAAQFRDAQGQMQAQLGVTADEAAALGDVAREVFGNNFGDSVEDVGQSIIEVRQQMKGLADDELAGATESALALRDAFGFEVTESTNAANVLMEKFGLTSQQAFDFITKGQQAGLNTSGDFLETITEYGNLMGDNGFSAEQFFSIMETGLEGGVLGTDKAADAFKEFGIRIQDGSTTTRDALASLGLEDIFTGISDGSMTVADAFPRIQEALAGITDPVAQAQAGVALFGTQWEDMGADAMLALSTTTTSMADMEGATASLNAQYTSLGGVWEGVSRGFLLALEPVGVVLLDLANQAMPHLLAGAEQLRAGIEVAIGFIGPFIAGAVAFITGLLAGEGSSSLSGWGAQFETTRAAIETAINAVWGVVSQIVGQLTAFWAENGAQITADATETWNLLYETVSQVIGLISAIVTEVAGGIASFLREHGDEIEIIFSTAFNNAKATVDMVLGVIQGIVKTVSSAMKGDWEGALNGIKQIGDSVFNGLKTIITNTVEGAQRIWASNVDGIKKKTDEVFNGLKGTVEGALNGLTGTITSLGGRFADAGKALIENLWKGIKERFDTLIADARRRLQELTDMLPGSEPKDPTSPLRGLGRRGEAFVANFGEPLLAGLSNLNLQPALAGITGQLDAALGGELEGASARALADVRVRVDESPLRDLIRVEVREQSEASGQRVLNRRKLG